MDLERRRIVLWIYVAKTKTLNSCAVTAQLICAFVFSSAKSLSSHDAARILFVNHCCVLEIQPSHKNTCLYHSPEPQKVDSLKILNLANTSANKTKAPFRLCMCRLAFVVHKWLKAGFFMTWLDCFTILCCFYLRYRFTREN